MKRIYVDGSEVEWKQHDDAYWLKIADKWVHVAIITEPQPTKTGDGQ